MLAESLEIKQNVLLHDHLAAPIRELVDSHNIHQNLSVNTVNMNVQEEHVMEDPVVDSDRVRRSDAPLERTKKDQASSSQGDKDSGLWRGHEVNPEFVCLLDRIMHTYPETFEHFTTKNKMLSAMNLNLLCTSLDNFSKVSLTEVDCEMIDGYRDICAYLQNQGFDVSWGVNRLNYIENLCFSQPLIPELHGIDCCIEGAKTEVQHQQAHVDDAKSNIQDLQARAKINVQDLQARVDYSKTKLQELQTLRRKKMADIEKAFGTRGTNLAVGFIGDYLLYGP